MENEHKYFAHTGDKARTETYPSIGTIRPDFTIVQIKIVVTVPLYLDVNIIPFPC